MPFCSRCGFQIDIARAGFCPICGTNLMTTASPALTIQPVYVPPLFAPDPQGVYYLPQMIVPLRLKSTTIAAVLSLFLVGTGQIYTGRTARGLGIMAVLALIGFAGYSVYGLLGVLLVIPYILGIFAWQVYDAYNLAKKYNEYTRTYTRPPW